MKLYLYLLTQSIIVGCDTYDSAVVCAESEDEARKIHPAGFEADWSRWEWPKDTAKVKVELIGRAMDHVEPGVICASFNAN